MNSSRPWVVLGNPENRRVTLFQGALASRGIKPATVVSYRGLLVGHESLDDVPSDAVVRIDSPGENFDVEKLLLAAGEADAAREGTPHLPADAIENLADDRGLIRYPRQWYLGFLAALRPALTRLSQRKDVLLTTSHRDLEVLFDKSQCHACCQESGVPVPECLGPIQGWEMLVSRMRELAWTRVFVKLAHGSSASGVVALRVLGDRCEAITSAELVRSDGRIALYNSLKIQRYTELEDVRDLINALSPHGVHVEQWLPKAAAERGVCDLRVVVIAGEPRHIVVRTSRSPLTNLHLGNRRGDLKAFLQRLQQEQYAALLETCRRAAAVFPDSLQLGLDVLFTPGFRRHFVLEANAFGDLLPGVLHEGCDTYQAEIDAVVRASRVTA